MRNKVQSITQELSPHTRHTQGSLGQNQTDVKTEFRNENGLSRHRGLNQKPDTKVLVTLQTDFPTTEIGAPISPKIRTV